MFAPMHENMGAFDGGNRICSMCCRMLPDSEFFVYRSTGKPRYSCKHCSTNKNKKNYHSNGYGYARKVRKYTKENTK